MLSIWAFEHCITKHIFKWFFLAAHSKQHTNTYVAHTNESETWVKHTKHFYRWNETISPPRRRKFSQPKYNTPRHRMKESTFEATLFPTLLLPSVVHLFLIVVMRCHGWFVWSWVPHDVEHKVNERKRATWPSGWAVLSWANTAEQSKTSRLGIWSLCSQASYEYAAYVCKCSELFQRADGDTSYWFVVFFFIFWFRLLKW